MSGERVEENGKARLRESREYEDTKRILGILFANLKSLGSMNKMPSPDFFVRNCKDFYDKWQEAEKISEILRVLKSEITYHDKKVESMSKMLAYLGLVESLGVTLMDMVLILLIANGREVHITRGRVKHVTSFEELKEIDLGYKLDFLKDEGLEIFRWFMNQEVRNIVAHLKFIIDNDGSVRKRDGTLVDIDIEISRFWDGIDILKLVFEDIGFLRYAEKTATLLTE